ncbi:MAG: hypothetical protein IJX67_06075 [Oscillospiraceae bacterium]|nr:hypothetical protein [Oscillospiraceae bacterium]
MEKHSFEYTYSAPQQEEINRIRKKYAFQEQAIDKMEQLRQLDKSTEKPGKILAIILCIVGALMLGFSMSCATVPDLAEYFIPGIVVGIVGIVAIITSYPIYKAVTKKRRNKIAPMILQLTDELSQESL